MSAPREAAVLVPVHLDAEGRVRMVLVRRTQGGLHGGQLAFPGGGIEPTDPSPLEAACREAEEEIGLPRGAAHLITALPLVDTRATGYQIHPFLVTIGRPRAWRLQASEIEEVLEPALEQLADPARHGTADDLQPGVRLPVAMPYIQVGEHRLWGASHRIVGPLLPRLAAGEWPLGIPLRERTARLELVAASLEDLETELREPGRLGERLGVVVPPGWPPGQYDRNAIEAMRTRLSTDGDAVAGWLGWYALERVTGGGPPPLVGSCGYLGPPDASGRVEIGYSVVPAWRGRGIAMEMIHALVRRALATPGVRRIEARVEAANLPSRRALERSGFRSTGASDETGQLRYELAADVPGD